MKLYDLKEIEETLEKINSSIAVEIKKLDLKEHSNLGNAILNNLKPEENVLLITDGQNNFGISLNDLALFSNNINSKLFAIKLKPEYNDFNVKIDGPDKVVSNVENRFLIKVDYANKFAQLSDKELPNLKVYLDDNLVYQGKTLNYELKKSFASGNHILRAELEFSNEKQEQKEIDKNDVFKENNVFYKVINVYDKPKILLITENTNSNYKKIL